ncbi:MAG: DUF4377 domain-containing protein [Prevotella sp.]|nr:DUF4377 domain-containing protein [Prevotella sp.]MDY4682814.1 DUF4377 domain-containing protein [Prevotella sp.]
MKKTHLYFITSILLALFTFAISSCSDDDDVETSTMIVEIDSESNLVFVLTGSLEPGMWVREEGKKNWEKWPQWRIKGFSFEEGYYTKLQIIKKIDHKLEGQDGGDPDSYQLQKILEKKPSESIRNK